MYFGMMFTALGMLQMCLGMLYMDQEGLRWVWVWSESVRIESGLQVDMTRCD